MNNYENWLKENRLRGESDVVAHVLESISDPVERCSACPARCFCDGKYDRNGEHVPWMEDRCWNVLREWADTNFESEACGYLDGKYSEAVEKIKEAVGKLPEGVLVSAEGWDLPMKGTCVLGNNYRWTFADGSFIVLSKRARNHELKVEIVRYCGSLEKTDGSQDGKAEEMISAACRFVEELSKTEN